MRPLTCPWTLRLHCGMFSMTDFGTLKFPLLCLAICRPCARRLARRVLKEKRPQ